MQRQPVSSVAQSCLTLCEPTDCSMPGLHDMRSTSCKMLPGWITSWNQDCWEKYQQPQICRWNHSNGRKQRGTKESYSMRTKVENEKAGIKLNIQKTKIMASSSITSWQTEREKLETVTDFIFLGSKITVEGDCSHESKRSLPLRRKAMTNLDNV